MRPLQQLIPIYLVIFFGYIGYSLIITIFTPLFLNPHSRLLPLTASKDERILALGLVVFVYPFGQFLSSPILGALSDRVGRRPVILFSLGVTIIMYALVGVGVWLSSLSLIVISLLIAGLSEGNATIAQSAIADVSLKSERSRLFGYISFSASLSYIVGPLLGGRLADFDINSTNSFATPFFVVSLLMVGTLFWLYFAFKESLVFHKRTKISFFDAFTNLKNLFHFRHLRFYFLVNFVLYLAIFGYFQSFPLYIVSRFNVGVWPLSIFIAWSSIPFIFVNLWLTGALAKRFLPTQVAAFSAIWLGIFIQILLIPTHQDALWITLILVGIGAASCLPAAAATVSSHADDHEQGRVMGINQSLQFFAEAFAGLAMAFLAAIFVKLSLIIFGILGLLGAALLLFKKDFSLR